MTTVVVVTVGDRRYNVCQSEDALKAKDEANRLVRDARALAVAWQKWLLANPVVYPAALGCNPAFAPYRGAYRAACTYLARKFGFAGIVVTEDFCHDGTMSEIEVSLETPAVL